MGVFVPAAFIYIVDKGGVDYRWQSFSIDTEELAKLVHEIYLLKEKVTARINSLESVILDSFEQKK
eukprot:m.163417 g.163417  ORF g.163417 m.163417 type:complete len:66 (-) comp31290_c0_seq6:294-491(-)